MLFNIDDEKLFKEYFNLEQDSNNTQILNPKEGLILGNMSYDMYKPYKNYKPRELVACSEQDKLLLRIRELAFAVNDLNLHLDVNPEDKETFCLFKLYVEELNRLQKVYSEKYEVLEINDDLKDCYTWYKNPWPWEVDSNV